MAYRLAEVRVAVEEASDTAARKSAIAEQDSLIMALWARRETLPEKMGVDRRVGAATKIIEHLLSDPNPWRRKPDPPRDPAETIGAINDVWKHLFPVVAVLIFKREAAELGPEDPDLPLTKEERADRERWASFADTVLQGLRSGTISTYPPPALSDEEAIVLLEQGTLDAIVKLRNHLAHLEALLLPKKHDT